MTVLSMPPFTAPGRSQLTGPIALPVFDTSAVAAASEPVFAQLAIEWGYSPAGIAPTGVRAHEGRVL